MKCAVPFCPNDRKAHDGDMPEWLCRQHFKLVDWRVRRLHLRMVRYQHNGILSIASHRLMKVVWERCKRQAIEKAAGIA